MLLDVIMSKAESTHVRFLLYITVKWSKCQANESWKTPVYKKVILAFGVLSEAMYKCYQQVKVAKWVDLQTLLEV